MPKQTKDYLDRLLNDADADTRESILDLYNKWKSEKSISHFDHFWMKVNKNFSRSRLREFNGVSFEEFVYESIRSHHSNLKERSFWGLDPDPSKRKKVKFQIFRGLKHKFDIAVYGVKGNPAILIECKTFPNYIEILGIAKLGKLPVFQQAHIIYVTHLMTSWDLENGLREFILENISEIRNFNFYKIDNLVWTNKDPLLYSEGLDQEKGFLQSFNSKLT